MSLVILHCRIIPQTDNHFEFQSFLKRFPTLLSGFSPGLEAAVADARHIRVREPQRGGIRLTILGMPTAIRRISHAPTYAAMITARVTVCALRSAAAPVQRAP